MSERTTRWWAEWFQTSEVDCGAATIHPKSRDILAAKLRKLAEIEEAAGLAEWQCSQGGVFTGYTLGDAVVGRAVRSALRPEQPEPIEVTFPDTHTIRRIVREQMARQFAARVDAEIMGITPDRVDVLSARIARLEQEVGI